jgi:arginyl-tRNA synthetase
MIIELVNKIKNRLTLIFNEDGFDIDEQGIIIDIPAYTKFGDLYSNCLLRFSPDNVDNLSRKIVEQSEKFDEIEKTEITSNKFVNFYFSKNFLLEELLNIFNAPEILPFKKRVGEQVQVEFVSANPTGPLNVVSARAATVGDSLANMLKRYGYDVQREYYVNDTGNQVRIFAKSILLAFRILKGEKLQFPEDFYHGDYISELANEFSDEIEEIEVDKREDWILENILYKYLEKQKMTLKDFGVKYDNWFKESDLIKNNEYENVYKILKTKNLLYEKDGATWLKSTELGDVKDWVLIKMTGQYTYLYSDIVYHINKFNRGFCKVFNLLGPANLDHIKRVKKVLKAFDIPDDWLQKIMVQQVNFIREGKRVKMSKRKGVYEILQELMTEIGKDAARFAFLLRSGNQHLDFDLNLVKAEISQNPVFYVQYANARIASIFRKLKEEGKKFNTQVNLLTDIYNEEEYSIIKDLIFFPLIFKNAVNLYDPSKLVTYIRNLADKFHHYYQFNRVLIEDNDDLMNARLILVSCIQKVIQEVLNIIGVAFPSVM